MGHTNAQRAMLIAALLLLGSLTVFISPAEAGSWVRTDMGKGYDATAQGGLYGVALGDGDRDGKMEAYASCYDNGHIYEYRRENLKWTVKDLGVLWPGRYPRADAVLVGDGDDDGRTEVYASGLMYTTGSLINSVYQLVNGTNGWTKTDIGASGGWGMDLAMGDGNRDGRTELYSADADGHIYQYSKWNSWNILDIGGAVPFRYNNNWFMPYMRSVKVGDADNDGRVEVYGAATDNHAYRFNFTGSEWERTDLGAGENSTFPLYGLLGIVIGDADNDGKNEAYASSYLNGTVWRFKWDAGSASWNVSRLFFLGGSITANDLCIGDGNSDGNNEIYIGTSNKQLYQVRLEQGTWKNTSIGSGNGAINGVAVGSVTNDTQVLQLFAASGDGHCYEYYQDLVAPANPVVWSDTHPVTGKWYNDRRVHVLWEQPGSDISGIDGYSTAWDGAADTIPDWTVDLEESTTEIFTTLGDGRWYFHIRVRDNALNWNTTAAHFGPVLIDTTSPDHVQLAINGGADLTNGRFVSLSINATDPSPGSGIAQMAFSNDGSNWSEWEAFCATHAGWDLTDPSFGGNESDGSKTVFAKVRDGVGREVAADRRGRATTLLDRRAPEGLALSVDGGAGSTSSADVDLEVGARDPVPGSGLARMAFSNDGVTWGEWMQWRNCTGWSLTAGAGGTGAEGGRTVFFRVQDRAGNVGGPVNASIFLDTGRPRDLRITINDGALYTDDPVAALNISAADPKPASLPLQMALSNSDCVTGEWEPFSDRKQTWGLTFGPGGTDTDGEKMVCLRVRDAAGNIGGPANATIFLDRLKPGPLGIVVNGGANRTNGPAVELSVEACDTAPSSGVDLMQFSADGTNWSAWEPYSPRKHYNLSGPDGPKTILFRVRDRAGNVADAVSASMVLHASPPVISALTVSGVTNDSATISWSTDEPSVGLVVFGTGPALDHNRTSGGWAQNHTVRLTGLTNSTTYRFRVSSMDELFNNATSSPDLNFTTLETYTPPPPGPKPVMSHEDGLPWAWVAVPLLAAGVIAGLLVVGRSRRRVAKGSDPRETLTEGTGRGLPGAARHDREVPARTEAVRANAVYWGPPEPAAPAHPGREEDLETVQMDHDIPVAAAVAAIPGPAVHRTTRPATGTQTARTVRCTGCGTSVPVLPTTFPVRIMCTGCGRIGVYRGPRGS